MNQFASFVVTFVCLGRESILLTFNFQPSKTHHDLATVTESAKDLLISKVGGSTNLWPIWLEMKVIKAACQTSNNMSCSGDLSSKAMQWCQFQQQKLPMAVRFDKVLHFEGSGLFSGISVLIDSEWWKQLRMWTACWEIWEYKGSCIGQKFPFIIEICFFTTSFAFSFIVYRPFKKNKEEPQKKNSCTRLLGTQPVRF